VLAIVHACITHKHTPNRKNQPVQASMTIYQTQKSWN